MTRNTYSDNAEQMNPAFKPYVLWRRGLLPFLALSPLVPESTWALLDEAERGRAWRRDIANRLGDSLHALIPAVEVRERRPVLQLRRDLHNDRLLDGEAMVAAERLLGAADGALLREWQQSRLSDERLYTSAAERLEAELQVARQRLAEVASQEHFLRGIQLSGSSMYLNVRDYILSARQPGSSRRLKRLRKTESTIVSYAYRMVLRTSPFGSFTEIGAQPWRPLPSAPVSLQGKRRHLVRLNRGLLTWMAYELRRIEGKDQLLRLRLNNTLRLSSDRLEAFTRGVDGSAHGYWGERFVSLAAVDAVAAVVAMLSEAPLSRAEVLRRLGDRGVPDESASVFIDRLVEAGVCHQDLGLPDQVGSFAAAVAARLRTIPTQQATACAEVFEALRRVEDGFGTATLEQREQMLDTITHQAHRLSEICGIPPPPAVSRTFVFEDVAACGQARSWEPDLIERNSGRFSLLQRILPALDEATFEKLGVYHWFVSRFGEGGRCDDLLALYRSFAEQSPADISAIMQATHAPHGEQVRELQRRLLERLEGLVTAAAGAASINLDERCLGDLAASLPSFLPAWTDALYRLQLVPASVDGGPLIVVNDITSGHGAFFSRFCDLLEPGEPGGWSLSHELRAAINSTSPRQADLTAVFGLNVNLHPRLTPLEVVYPGSYAVGGEGVLTLRDLAVEADPVRHALRVVSRRDGQPIELTPMNFLFPAAAPLLYRFLYSLSPMHPYRIRLWDRLRRVSRHPPAYLPRLMLGGLVLERRSWYIPVAEAGELGDDSSSVTVDELLAARRWQHQHGLPRECFFRLHEQAGSQEGPRSWVEETRRWALAARTAKRKPHYLDFRNPFLVRLLSKQARTAASGLVLFQECLPLASGCYGSGRGPESAEELLIELRMQAAGLPAMEVP